MYGLVGKNIQYSYSTAIHKLLRPDINYQLFDLSETQFQIFMQDKNFSGLNITTPYKERILPYLDSLDVIANKTQSINTVIKRKDQLVGYNTDYYGFEELIKHHKIDLRNKVIVILGSGGSSKTLQRYIKKFTKQLIVVSRHPLDNYYSYEELRLFPMIDILINATPVGAFPNIDQSPIQLLKLTARPKIVIDLIYNPPRSNLLVQAKELGCKTYNGLWMLISQAYLSQSIFFKEIPTAIPAIQLYSSFNKSNNIVLIGMPTSGKSTIGQMLALKLGKTFIDTDWEIEKTWGISCAEIITTQGIDAFRAYERSIVKKVMTSLDCVIATGGGIVENSANIFDLSHFGRIYFIDRPLELLMPSRSNPLSARREDLQNLYLSRISSYRSLCDQRIANSRSLEACCNLILEDFHAYCHN